MSEARDEPIANWIANPNKYDRRRARRGLEQRNCGIAKRYDYVLPRTQRVPQQRAAFRPSCQSTSGFLCGRRDRRGLIPGSHR
jgi:hypothetical protein